MRFNNLFLQNSFTLSAEKNNVSGSKFGHNEGLKIKSFLTSYQVEKQLIYFYPDSFIDRIKCATNCFANGIFSVILIVRSKIFSAKFEFAKVKVLEKCTKNLVGHSRLAFNNHKSNIDC